MEQLYRDILLLADAANHDMDDVDFIKLICKIYHEHEIALNTDVVLMRIFLEIAEPFETQNSDAEKSELLYIMNLVKKLKKNIWIKELPKWRLHEMALLGTNCSKQIMS